MMEAETVQDVHELVDRFNERTDVDLTDQGLKLFEEGGELAEEILGANGDLLFKDDVDGSGIEEEVGQVIYTAWSIGRLAGIDPFVAVYDQAVANEGRVNED